MEWFDLVLYDVMVAVSAIIFRFILNNGVLNWMEILWMVGVMIWNIHSWQNAMLVPWVRSDIGLVIVCVVKLWMVSVSDMVLNIMVNLVVWMGHISFSVMNN